MEENVIARALEPMEREGVDVRTDLFRLIYFMLGFIYFVLCHVRSLGLILGLIYFMFG